MILSLFQIRVSVYRLVGPKIREDKFVGCNSYYGTVLLVKSLIVKMMCTVEEVDEAPIADVSRLEDAV